MKAFCEMASRFKVGFSGFYFLVKAVFLFALTLSGYSQTFPLPIPKRPTSFPLSRPTKVGEVIVWGDNSFGQTNVPPGLTNVVAIASGSEHLIALRNDGTVVSWGYNAGGQTNVPAGLTNVVAVAAGVNSSVALKSDGSVVLWGSLHQYGDGSTNVVAISANYYYWEDLRQDGTITISGQVNDSAQSNIPNNLSNVVAISAGWTDDVALKSDGTVVAWGSGGRARTNVPPGLQNIVAVSASLDRSEALRNNGTIVEWSFSRPVNQLPYTNAVAISAQRFCGAAILDNGKVVIWGEDSYTNTLAVPPYLRNAFAIFGGEQQLAVLREVRTRQATATAQLEGGFVVGLGEVISGNGYSLPPEVTITGGGGSEAKAIAQVVDGAVVGYTVIDAGFGYTSAPEVHIASPAPPQLKVEPSRVSVTMQLSPGGEYQLEASNDNETWTAVGAPIVASTSSLTQEFVIAETGRYFRLQQLGARATAHVTNGFVTRLDLVDGAGGYTEAPTVTISGGGGSGAIATAIVSNGAVVGFNMLRAGSGYTGVPTVDIAPPPPSTAAVAVSISRVRLPETLVWGTIYQLETSSDLKNWFSVAAPFTAGPDPSSQEVVITDNAHFFRLLEVP